MSGFPVHWGNGNGDGETGWTALVIGDVDGDQQPDIVVTSRAKYDTEGRRGYLLVFDRGGRIHPRFPRELPIGWGGVPAIADLDLDGRNEIIVAGEYWSGVEEFQDTLWVFDLGGPAHGRIEWGQLHGGPKHQKRYPVVE